MRKASLEVGGVEAAPRRTPEIGPKPAIVTVVDGV
jgi:hypothetical protein